MLFLPKEVETVITTLQGAGYSPYLVGGCVREMLRGKAPSDYDMTSDALPQEEEREARPARPCSDDGDARGHIRALL